MVQAVISIVIPVHNEAVTIVAVVQSLIVACNGRRVEIIVVDDASTDGSSARIEALAEAGVVIHVNRTRQGSGAARRLGTTLAKGEAIVWMDGDGTYRAEDVVRVIDSLPGWDQVIGARTTETGTHPWLRRSVKWLANGLVSLLWRMPIPDLNSGMRAFRQEAAIAICAELPDGFSCTSTATLASLNHGQRVAFCAIDYLPRPSGSVSKFHPILDTARLLRVIARQYRARFRSRHR